MSKRAFLVGINQFNRADWDLRGCVNDTLTMQQMLKENFGFQADQVHILHDQEATARNIREGLAWLFSDYSGGGSDVRLFHIASHGTQVADTDGDEDDALDEVIVPYDHAWHNPFTDDHLRAIFEQVPEDVAFTFIADCCHSGSINKVVYPAELDVRLRYVEPPEEILAEVAKLQQKRSEEESQWVEAHLAEERGNLSFPEWLSARESIREKLLARFRRQKRPKVESNTRPQVLLAACKDEQTAADAFINGQFQGAFTWSLAEAIRAANGPITYGDLIEQSVKLLKNYTQDPQLDCPDVLLSRPFLSSVGG
jgi:metacaspase-1